MLERCVQNTLLYTKTCLIIKGTLMALILKISAVSSRLFYTRWIISIEKVCIRISTVCTVTIDPITDIWCKPNVVNILQDPRTLHGF